MSTIEKVLQFAAKDPTAFARGVAIGGEFNSLIDESRIALTEPGIAWLSLENENACLRNERAVAREEIGKLELEKHGLMLRLVDAAEREEMLRLEIATLRRWLSDKTEAGA